MTAKMNNKATMHDKVFVTTEELSEYGPVGSLNDQVMALVKQQQDTWELAGKNYAALAEVKTKSFDFGHFTVHVHHNPGRIRSSAAKTDPQSIARRPCFLCIQNLPPEQKGVSFKDKYIILANPFPIFPKHLTIVSYEHTPQKIKPMFPDMLELSKALHGFTLFYNGPRSGASAPDHFHFQAGNRAFLPVERELKELKKQAAGLVFTADDLEIIAVEDYQRRFIAFSSPGKNVAIRAFEFIWHALSGGNDDEPMLNLLSFFEEGKWQVIVFPREKQRPSHFFKSGKDQIIIGPAAVEMGGILILPEKNNFNAINPRLISEIFNEITFPSAKFKLLIEKLSCYR